MGIVFAALLTLGTVLTAFAHQGKGLGDYKVEVGFAVEPAVQNQMNAIEFFAETKDGKKVEGLESTVKFDAIAGGKTRSIAIHAVEGDAGHYLGEFMPTLVGDYTFHMTGKIGDLAVDERFESGPNRFSSVVSAREVQFPKQLQSLDELSAGLAAADAKAADARTFGIAGIVVGIAGLAVGLVALLKRK
ncbi:MAG TPA: FixH family protein [Anaerolineae bacterium]|jgi:hypothetical protein